MTHQDARRRAGRYCRGECFLCFMAALWTLNGRTRESAAVLKAKPGVDVPLGERRRGDIGRAVQGFRRRLQARISVRRPKGRG